MTVVASPFLIYKGSVKKKKCKTYVMLKGHFRKLLVTQPKAAEKTCDLEFNSSDFMS